jgi:tripartite-type tricarboxylate transporter receptor subunit TctC
MKLKKILGVGISVLVVIALFAGCQKPAPSAAGSSAASAAASPAASWKPAKPVKMIVTFAAGGGNDTIARTIASNIDLDGQSMFVSNVEGAGGAIGIMEGYHADPDGYTLMVGSPEANSTQFVSGNLEVPANKDMIYVCSVAYDMNVLCVAPNTYKTWAEFVAAAKAKPGILTVASVGSGNSMEASIVDVCMKAGIDITYVPYDSASKSRAAALGKNADGLWCQLSEARTFIDAGELVALGIAGEVRATGIAPNLPTYKEMGVNDALSGIHRTVLLPPGTPKEIVDYYSAKIKAVYDKSDVQKILQDNLGYSLEWLAGDDVNKMADSIQKWAEYIIPIILN